MEVRNHLYSSSAKMSRKPWILITSLRNLQDFVKVFSFREESKKKSSLAKGTNLVYFVSYTLKEIISQID